MGLGTATARRDDPIPLQGLARDHIALAGSSGTSPLPGSSTLAAVLPSSAVAPGALQVLHDSALSRHRLRRSSMPRRPQTDRLRIRTAADWPSARSSRRAVLTGAASWLQRGRSRTGFDPGCPLLGVAPSTPGCDGAGTPSVCSRCSLGCVIECGRRSSQSCALARVQRSGRSRSGHRPLRVAERCELAQRVPPGSSPHSRSRRLPPPVGVSL